MKILEGMSFGIFGCIMVFTIIVLAFGLSTAVIYCIWNYLVVAAFNATPITWFQSFVAAICLSVVGSFFKSSSSSK